MQAALRGAVSIILLAGIGTAALGQTSPMTPGSRPAEIIDPSTLQLTPAQKKAIFETVRKERAKIAIPTKFEAAVGAAVPPSIELYLLPDDALREVPGAKSVKYTMVDDQVVLVDPTTMRVIDIIRQ
jgi:hypothetical protein